MENTTYKVNGLKYKNTDLEKRMFVELMNRQKHYLAAKTNGKNGDMALAFKALFYLTAGMAAYSFFLTTSSESLFVTSYVIFGFAMLLLSLNIGHDAAHHAVTGNKKVDDFIFRVCFMIQGLSGYLWQIRHNNSHHNYPNIYDEDTDMDMGGILLLDPELEKKWFHRFQHYYAGIIYLIGGMILIYYLDLEMMLKKKHGNINVSKIPFIEWVKFAFSKILHVGIYLLIPIYFGSFSVITVFAAYFIFQFSASIFMFMTFVISHHVMEVAHMRAEPSGRLDDTWLKHQIVSTIDFSEKSRLGNFLFGGFNLHIAHHVFPAVSHTHYPALTREIKDVLKEYNCEDWYKSYSFWDGCISHFKYLKRVALIDSEESIQLTTIVKAEI